MKRFALMFALAGALSAAAAQGQAAAQAMPSGVMTAKAHADRLDILRTEREQISGRLTAAVNALPKTQTTNMPEALKEVGRRQADLEAIDREISRAEAQSSGVSAARKPVAVAAGDLSQVQPVIEPKREDEAYESWDVFQNFGKKVTK